MSVGGTPLRASGPSRSGEEVIQIAIRLGLLALLIYWSFVLLEPFIPILAWSVVLTVSLYPVFDRLSAYLGHRPRLAAAIITVAMLAVFLGPATWLRPRPGRRPAQPLRSTDFGRSDNSIAARQRPRLATDRPDAARVLANGVGQPANRVSPGCAVSAAVRGGPILTIAGNAGTGTIKFLVSVVISGFLFPPGPQLVASIRNILLRIVPPRSADFLALAGATIRTVAQGVIGIAVLQALFAGIVLKVAGVPYAGGLAFLVLVLGIIQIGSAPILIPGRDLDLDGQGRRARRPDHDLPGAGGESPTTHSSLF